MFSALATALHMLAVAAALTWSAAEARRDDFRSAVAEAIAKRDADAAEKLTRQSLRAMVEQLESALVQPAASRRTVAPRRRTRKGS